MQGLIPSDKIKLRLKKSPMGDLTTSEEHILSLSDKLTELFAAGYVRDDIYGLVIPLLMQGKVRIDLDDRSERLELDDQTQKFQRTNAVQVFEDYLVVYQPGISSGKPAVLPAN